MVLLVCFIHSYLLLEKPFDISVLIYYAQNNAYFTATDMLLGNFAPGSRISKVQEIITQNYNAIRVNLFCDCKAYCGNFCGDCFSSKFVFYYLFSCVYVDK